MVQQRNIHREAQEQGKLETASWCAVVLMQKYFSTQSLARSQVSGGGKEPRSQGGSLLLNHLFIESQKCRYIVVIYIGHRKDSNQT